MEIYSTDLVNIENICNHEAGHYIIAKELGFITNGISIEIRIDGYSGEAVLEPRTSGINNFTELENYLRRRIKVLYAGVISESYEMENCSDYALNQWNSGGGKDDHSKIRELTQVLRNIIYPNTENEPEAQKELDNIDSELFGQTVEIVSERLQLIRGIASMLSVKVKEYNIRYTLTETEINDVVNIKELYIK